MINDFSGWNTHPLQESQRGDLTRKNVVLNKFRQKSRIVEPDSGQPDNAVLKPDINMAIYNDHPSSPVNVGCQPWNRTRHPVS